MSYLVLFPSLICGLALCVEDARSRRIPRLWVVSGFIVQLVALAGYAIAVNDIFIVLQALLFTALCTLVQLGLAIARPGSLGLGDVTCIPVIALAPGMFGLMTVIVWWLLMGVLGLAWLAVWPHLPHRLRINNSDPTISKSNKPDKACDGNDKNDRDRKARNRSHDKAPFAPVIVFAAIIAVCIGPIL